MTSPSPILFDAGGVLVHPDWRLVSALLANLGHALPAEALAAQEHPAWRTLDDAGLARGNDGRRVKAFLAWVLGAAGLPAHAIDAAQDAIEGPRRAGQLWVDVPPEVPGALAALKARGHRLGVVSNSNGTVKAKLVEVGLGGFFEVMLDSAEEGVEKPDPEIFRRALARMGVEGGWFVGDLYHIDVVGARAAGLSPVLMDRAWLRDDADCPRIRSLDGLLALV